MVQLDSPLRRKINLALIALRENGTYQQIYDKCSALLRTSQLEAAAIAISALRNTVVLVAECGARASATSLDARAVAECIDRSAVGDQRPQSVRGFHQSPDSVGHRFSTGRDHKVGDAVNIEPLLPFSINADWT